jgi:hypothetical protein
VSSGLGADSWRIARRPPQPAAFLVGLAALALSGLALSACGGSSGGSSATTTGARTSSGQAAPASTPAGSSTTSTTQPASQPVGTTPSTPPAGPSNPARARFIGQADQICRAANTALLGPQKNVNAAFKAEQAKGTAAHRTALATAVRAESSVAAAELIRLRALTPPAADRLLVEKYLGAIGSQVGLVNQLATSVAANNGTRLSAVGKQLAAGKSTVDGLAGAYGFKVCGNVSP